MMKKVFVADGDDTSLPMVEEVRELLLIIDFNLTGHDAAGGGIW